MQALLALLLLNVPISQSVHAVEELVGLYEPGVQVRQTLNCSPLL